MEFNPIQTSPFSLGIKLKSLLWSLVNITIFRYSPFFCRRFRIFLVRLFGGNVSYTSSLHRKSRIDHPWNLTVGSLSSLGENSWVYCLDNIYIGDKCCIGKDVYLLTGSHNISRSDFVLETKPIKIGDCVWVATGAYILPGVEIGHFCVVSAKSVVIKSIDKYVVVGGNPAKFIKKREIKE